MVVAVLPIVICFQSLILDMAGNVGTQSLAVTIRVLMDEDLRTKGQSSISFKGNESRILQWLAFRRDGICVFRILHWFL